MRWRRVLLWDRLGAGYGSLQAAGRGSFQQLSLKVECTVQWVCLGVSWSQCSTQLERRCCLSHTQSDSSAKTPALAPATLHICVCRNAHTNTPYQVIHVCRTSLLGEKQSEMTSLLGLRRRTCGGGVCEKKTMKKKDSSALDYFLCSFLNSCKNGITKRKWLLCWGSG